MQIVILLKGTRIRNVKDKYLYINPQRGLLHFAFWTKEICRLTLYHNLN